MTNLEKLNDWKAEHPDRVKANDKRRLKKWRENNPEKRKAQGRRAATARRVKDYYGKNKDRIKHNYLIRKYGITLEKYNQILLEQNNACGICGASKCSSGRSLAVDHDPVTGDVRGILCRNCNTGIGMFFHNIEFLRKAIKYLD